MAQCPGVRATCKRHHEILFFRFILQASLGTGFATPPPPMSLSMCLSTSPSFSLSPPIISMFLSFSPLSLYLSVYLYKAFKLCTIFSSQRKRREKRFEPEGSEIYKDVNNNIDRCMKKAKESWIGEQCSEIEDSLKKNNCKRAYQLVKDLTTVKQGESDYCPRSFRKMPHRKKKRRY